MSLHARLRHTVTVERAARGARNEYGVKSASWSPHLTVRAWVQPVTRREVTESTEGGALRSEYRMFTMVHDIRESDRIVWGTQTFHVTEVVNAAGKDHHLEVALRRVEVQA